MLVLQNAPLFSTQDRKKNSKRKRAKEIEKAIDFNFEIYKKIYSVINIENLLKSAGLEIKKLYLKHKNFFDSYW